MTAEDDMPWWVVRRGADDEAAFVDDVSGALYVPSAAPEIRMFAEVMAVLDLSSQAPQRGSTLSQRLTEERAERERGEAGANVIPLRRLAFVRSAAAIGVAAALGLGLVTVSAYAGVLPDSVQKIAHSVINAPSPKPDDDKPGDDTSNDPRQGGTGSAAVVPGPAGATGGPNGAASGAYGLNGTSTAGAPHDSGAASSAAPAQSATDGSTPTNAAPTGSGSNNGRGKGHKSTSPSPTPTPAPTDGSSNTPKRHG